jgi:hypothetical protein
MREQLGGCVRTIQVEVIVDYPVRGCGASCRKSDPVRARTKWVGKGPGALRKCLGVRRYIFPAWKLPFTTTNSRTPPVQVEAQRLLTFTAFTLAPAGTLTS